MRLATGIGLVLIAFTGTAFAQPPAYSPSEGKYSIKFPGTPKVTEKTAKTALGELTVTIATYANSDGSTFMVSYSDFPAEAVKPDKRAALIDGIRDGVAGKVGKIADEKELTLGDDKWPGREFTVEKGRQRIKFRVFIRENRVYQVAVIGTADFIKGRDATTFLGSLELTK